VLKAVYRENDEASVEESSNWVRVSLNYSILFRGIDAPAEEFHVQINLGAVLLCPSLLGNSKLAGSHN
jgi:hypothetical protein